MSAQPASPKAAAVRDTCAELTSTGKPVTFTAVAELTGISRTTLYRRHDLRALIEQYRQPARNTLTLAQMTAQIDQLRHSLEATAATVRRHEDQLRALKQDRTRQLSRRATPPAPGPGPDQPDNRRTAGPLQGSAGPSTWSNTCFSRSAAIASSQSIAR